MFPCSPSEIPALVAGNLHNHFPAWECIANIALFDLTPKILLWIKNCVDVRDFFQPFRGQYRGENFDSTLPPHRIFSNAPSCKPFAQFISDTIIYRLRTGAISLWGRVGEVPPPHLVMPLTVEPSKPRLCNDNRFLNLWIRDMPFQLDSLLGLPRYVFPSSFQSVCDDKSGYDHVLLTPESRPYFGFQWGGWYFTSNTIPFGWKSYGAQLVPPNFSHQVSFSRRQFSLVRLLFFGTPIFFGMTFSFRHDFFFRYNLFFLARLFFFGTTRTGHRWPIIVVAHGHPNSSNKTVESVTDTFTMEEVGNLSTESVFLIMIA